MQHIGKSKIGKISAKGNDYPQLRLPLQYANTVGEIADVFETEHEGKQAFLIVKEQSVPKEDTVLKPTEEVLKPCASGTKPSPEILPKNTPASTQQSEPDSRSKSTAESFIINPWLVSCAASGSRVACASPGSVAAYHGALSRLRLGFKSRLGRSLFCFLLNNGASQLKQKSVNSSVNSNLNIPTCHSLCCRLLPKTSTNI